MIEEHKISRRALLKSAAKASVYATVGLSTSFAAAAISAPSDTHKKPLNRAEKFIFDTLNRSLESSEKVQTSDIRQYSKDLVEHLGPKFDYKKKYSSVMGEYDLARQFIKSTDQYSNTRSDVDSVIRYIELNTRAISV